jgi:glycosyltransferase involved in cell wall biosynthesis
MKPRVSVVVTAKDEDEAIIGALARIAEAVEVPSEILVVCDSLEDKTVPWVKKYAEEDDRVRLVINVYGPGPARAIRSGFDAALADVVVVRYSRGGQQVGGPLLKSLMSRTAGASLYIFARVGTWDPTNSFKAYNRDFVREVGIDSDKGFEVGIELVAKARRLRLPVAEVPTIWLDRTTGVSHFKIAKWLSAYLRWYRFSFGPKLSVDQLHKQTSGEKKK